MKLPAADSQHVRAPLASILVSYNSAQDLDRQLRSGGLRQTFEQVVVVDNGSTDRSVSIARALGADVYVLRSNPGFGAAVNYGVRLTTGEFFAILNPDVFFDDPREVEQLMHPFADPRVGMVGPALILPDGRMQDSARSVPAPWQIVARRLTGRELGAVHDTSARDVDWLVGACMVVRRAAFEDSGGFDERYGMYFEDVDLCVRFWRRGWRVVYEPSSRVRHDHRADSRKTLIGKAMRRHLRSAARFYVTHPQLVTASARRRLRDLAWSA